LGDALTRFIEVTLMSSRFELGRQGSVAVWIALMIPVLTMALAFGVEVGGWEAVRMSTQRIADVSANAGVMNYKASLNGQTAATFAARMAQLNGASGTASPTWSSTCSSSCTTPCTGTLTDNQIIAQFITCSGTVNNSDVMIKVTVQKTVPAAMSRLFSSSSSYTITATGTSELVTSTGAATGAASGQPCLLALSTSGQITGSGSTYITMPNCTMVSNGTITFSGSGTLNTAGIFAGGAISIPNWFTVTGTQYPNNGTIQDPYANDAALQKALTTASGLTGVTNIACGSVGGVNGTAGQYTGNNNCNGTNTLPNGGTCVTGSGVTCTMYPGNYGSWVVTSGGPYTFNLQPGLYLFNGPITLTQNTTTNGSAVTIITSGAFTGSNTFNFYVTAPTVAQASSASPNSIPGVALAGNSTSQTTVSGAVNFVIDGVIYFPKAIFNASGSTSGSSSSPGMGSTSGACMEIIASSIYTAGYSNYNSNCSSLGATSFTSSPGSTTTSAQVVQ
jgi:hypothetical protein